MATINKSYKINAPADKVFEALTVANVMEKWTGDDVKMNAWENGEFSLWGGTIHGYNKVVNERKIVQNWKEETWEQYSEVTFALIEESPGVTTLALHHEGIPPASLNTINKGWEEYYVGPLRALLETSSN